MTEAATTDASNGLSLSARIGQLGQLAAMGKSPAEIASELGMPLAQVRQHLYALRSALVSDEAAGAAEDEDDVEEKVLTTAAPKKRGRPPGSKNKPKAELSPKQEKAYKKAKKRVEKLEAKTAKASKKEKKMALAAPKKRGRPPGSKNKPKFAGAVVTRAVITAPVARKAAFTAPTTPAKIGRYEAIGTLFEYSKTLGVSIDSLIALAQAAG